MTDRELKRRLSDAYAIEASGRKADFLNRFRTRELNYSELLRLQMRYMGAQLVLILAYTLLMLAEALLGVNADMIRITSALMPLAALVALTGLGRSERYGMNEFEMATRLSLRMIVILRLMIAAGAGAALMLTASLALKVVTGTGIFISIVLAGTPFLITSALCMMLIRKWHSRKNIYGCAAVALTVSAAMLLLFPCIESRSVDRAVPFILLVTSIILTICETRSFIRESEELKWNFC